MPIGRSDMVLGLRRYRSLKTVEGKTLGIRQVLDQSLVLHVPRGLGLTGAFRIGQKMRSFWLFRVLLPVLSGSWIFFHCLPGRPGCINCLEYHLGSGKSRNSGLHSSLRRFPEART